MLSCRSTFDHLVRSSRLPARRALTSSTTSTPRVIFSGIQPTGIPHLGNYLGALSNWVRLQRTASSHDKLLFSIVGWHALTLPQDPGTLRNSRGEMVAVLLAVGIDPKQSIIFHQDQNPAHAELAWILNCITPLGKLRRMTTWKSRLVVSRNANDESEVDESLLNAGLLTYPVLQAADILLYRTTHVPVGEDQRQHLELTRDLAESFNRTFSAGSPFFQLPQQISNPSQRILSLTTPTSKMSKSAHDPSSRILLTDTPHEIHAKIKKAVTDSKRGLSWDPIERPGVSNLIRILIACEQEYKRLENGVHTNDRHDEEVEILLRRYSGDERAIQNLKLHVSEAIVEALRSPRQQFERLMGEVGYLEQIAEDGLERAKELAEGTLRAVRKMVGLA